MIAALAKTLGVTALIVALIPHGTNATDIVVIFAALVYVVSVVKDFRPIKALRSDLAETRTEIEEKDRKIADLSQAVSEAVTRGEALAASRDFSTALAEALGKYEERATLRSEKLLQTFTEHDKHEREAWAQIMTELSTITHVLTQSAPSLPT